jgi:hypothetical protein
MRAAEHILLESDERNVPELRRARKIHARLRLGGRLRRRSIELALFDFYYLSVQTGRRGRPVSKYVVDLRFADPRFRLTRHIARRWMSASAVLATLTIAVAWHIGSSSAAWWRHDWLPVFGALFGLAACAVLVSLYRTTRTLTLFSVNGQARLLELTGGVGTFGAIGRFTRTLAAHVKLSIARRRTTRGAHLRDEMREHLRLKEAGVLSELEYEMSKRRILAKHA